MNYLSVCSGICAATVAWKPLGWKPAAFSEIDQKPCAVLRHHYPDVPIHGDFTSIKGDEYGAIDLIVGGTPCQDFSVAGLRSGFAGDRGNLTLEFVRLINRVRPKWVVWENVPGVLSIDEGRAFGAFLSGLAECGYGFSYRVLDAQYFGVPQRRRRVFVVGYLGDWRPAAAVLFERESLCGDITPRREAGESVAPTISARTKGGGGLGTDFDLDGGLIANTVTTREGSRQDPTKETYITHSLRGEGFDASEDGSGRGVPIIPIVPILAPTLDGRCGRSGASNFATSGGVIPIHDKATRHKGGGDDRNDDGSSNGLGIGEIGDPMPTLDTTSRHAIAFDCKASGSHGFGTGDIAPTLRSMNGERANGGGQIAVAAFKAGQGSKAGGIAYDESLAPTLGAANSGTNQAPSLMKGMTVRRLTPRECERLMGLPEIKNNITIYVCKEAEKTEIVSSAKASLMSQNQGAIKPVVLHVRIKLERGEVLISNQENKFYFVGSAEKQNLFHHHIPAADFVQLLAIMPSILVPITRAGKAESLRNTGFSSQALNGKGFVAVYGQEIEKLAKDAENITQKINQCTKSIISEAGQNSLDLDSAWQTWSCCVAAAINGFIAEKITAGLSYAINIESICPYTLVPLPLKRRQTRVRYMSDSARYKMIGNSFVREKLEWLGQRIELVNNLMTEMKNDNL